MATPEHAALLRDFVNTFDVEIALDALATPDDLADWFRERGLTTAKIKATGADLRAARGLRDALRTAMIAHHDHGDAGSRPDLDVACAAYPLRVSFRDGGPRLEPVGQGLSGGLSRLVAAIVAANADGTWERLKVCLEDTCQWAFLDTSKNRSRHWCSMRVCGNRTKTRNYRARRRASSSST